MLGSAAPVPTVRALRALPCGPFATEHSGRGSTIFGSATFGVASLRFGRAASTALTAADLPERYRVVDSSDWFGSGVRIEAAECQAPTTSLPGAAMPLSSTSRKRCSTRSKSSI